ncbi:YlbG family protein [Lacticaseibacillus suibinensis]|uniref:YlbG family protein n=1 Tax=Lacticaseibacillus suibinensis TaxID=2486011 RepID=UPI000F776E1D|nr:YlbG family protein [Lacticaseibacillus suibinensis]
MFTITPRQGLVVWVYSLKQSKALRHYGTIIYTSKRMKYVYLYLDQADLTETMAKLKKLRFVKGVSPSQKPFLATEYSGETSLAALEDDEDDDAPTEANHARD